MRLKRLEKLNNVICYLQSYNDEEVTEWGGQPPIFFIQISPSAERDTRVHSGVRIGL